MGAACSQPKLVACGEKVDTTAPYPKILIVGAGMGGMGCARALVRSGVARTSSILMVDPRDHFSSANLWPFVWTGRAPLADARWPLAAASESLKGVDLSPNTKLCALDLQGRVATLSGGVAHTYDFLVLAPGVVSDPSSIPGLEGHVDICDIGQAERARSELAAFVAAAKAAKESGGEKAVLAVSISSMPYKCPPMPFELAMLVDHQLREAGAREGARVVITSPVPFPIGGPPPNPASKVFLPLLEERGIEYMPKLELMRIAKSGSRWSVAYSQVGADTETEFEVDQMFAIHPQRAPDLFVSAGLTNKKGFIPVDLLTNRLEGAGDERKNVFVIGDAAWSVMPKPQQPHPKAGHVAWQMGEAVAKNIAATLEGAPDATPTQRGGPCILACGGGGAVRMEISVLKVLENPQEGGVKMEVSHDPSGQQEKITWANGYIAQVFGEGARSFRLAQ